MNIITVTTKGQATIPQEVRAKLALVPGDKVIYQNADPINREVVLKVLPTKNVVNELYGCLNPDGKIKYVPIEVARKKAGIMLAKKYGLKMKNGRSKTN